MSLTDKLLNAAKDPGPKPRAFDPPNCQRCRVLLPKPLHYFCRPCWDLAPPKERVALYGMHARREDTRAKVARICRLIERKHPTKNEDEAHKNLGPQL